MTLLKIGVLCAVLSWLPGCGRQIVEFAGDDSGTGGAAPAVIATVPVNGALAAARDTAITATFNAAMDPATIAGSSFLVRQGSTALLGAVTFDAASRTARFTPSVPLGAALTYTATITTGAKDLAGRALAADYTWTFTTSAAFTTSPPTVIFTDPSDLATNVSISKRPTATFSKAMDPATLTMLTFTVVQGVTPVLGTVTYDAPTNTARFSPSSPLALDTLYTATITTGARDAAGLALQADHMWSFTTGACSQAPVDLGSAGAFAALAGSTVTNTGPTSITGDLGVSPSTAITGFPPGVLIGTRHAGDPTAATANDDLTTAFNEVAVRMLCAQTVTGNTGGLTLTPGLYTSGSSLSISMGDLTLDAQGDSDGMFVFAINSTLTTTSGRRVILTNGAKAANVYWQVGSSATLGTGSVFHGTIMASQSITLDTGASLNGRALAITGAVNLDTNAIVTPLP